MTDMVFSCFQMYQIKIHLSFLNIKRTVCIVLVPFPEEVHRKHCTFLRLKQTNKYCIAYTKAPLHYSDSVPASLWLEMVMDRTYYLHF